MATSVSTLILILLSVAMSAVAQIFLKTGMSRGDVSSSLTQQRWGDSLIAVATSPWVVGGLTLYFLSAGVWLLVLARVQVSYAYPFVGIGFVVTMLLGWWLLDDTIGFGRLLGTLLIAIGVVLIARSG